MKKIKIYEFAGIPGAGKTTLCNKVLDEKKCITRLQIDMFYKKHKLFIRFMKLVFICSIMKIKRFVNDYNDVPEFFKEILLKLFITIISINVIHPNSLYIIDEGFVQNITSVAHEKEIKRDSILNDLIKVINKYFIIEVIYISVDINNAFKRIRDRNGSNRVDAFDDKTLKVYLENKKRNIEYIVSKMNVHILEFNDMLEIVKYM